MQDHAQVVAELANGTPQVRYTLGDERLSQQDAGGAFRFYETDGHGSVRALTDGAGEVTDTYAYDAFGTLLQQTGTSANDFRYTGEQFDAASGLYYLRARHYSPHSGRFTQRDTWEGNSQDPITLHKYVYGNSDPVTHIDPSGRFSLVEQGVADTIRSELNSMTIDAGFSLLDNLTNGASEQFTGPLAQINQAKMLAVAVIGSGSLVRMLSKKFRSKCAGNSFDGETLVHTRQGLVPIRDIRIGDEVLAFNEATGKEEYSPVVHLIRSDKEQGWVDVTTARGEVIQATAEHPFYAKSANDPSWQWVDAGKLLQGLELYTAGKDTEAVAGTRDYLAQRPAYNLTVDRTHTYFVGKDGVLVHNVRVCRLPELPPVHFNDVLSARKSARELAGVGADAVPFVADMGRLRGQVVTGMMSPDGKRGWRIDYDFRALPGSPEFKGFHINWWKEVDGVLMRGSKVIKGGTLDDYYDLLSHFPRT